jgi:hypothetical protein
MSLSIGLGCNSKICGNPDFTNSSGGASMVYMWPQNLFQADSSWINLSFGRFMKTPVYNSSFYLDGQHKIAWTKLERTRLELSQSLPTVPYNVQTAACATQPGLIGGSQINWYPLISPDESLAITPQMVEQWQWAWRLFATGKERLRETIKVLRKRLEILNRAIGLLLHLLSAPTFLHQLIRLERAWSLLHGAHPPKNDAGKCRPACAESGRASSMQVPIPL